VLCEQTTTATRKQTFDFRERCSSGVLPLMILPRLGIAVYAVRHTGQLGSAQAQQCELRACPPHSRTKESRIATEIDFKSRKCRRFQLGPNQRRRHGIHTKGKKSTLPRPGRESGMNCAGDPMRTQSLWPEFAQVRRYRMCSRDCQLECHACVETNGRVAQTRTRNLMEGRAMRVPIVSLVSNKVNGTRIARPSMKLI